MSWTTKPSMMVITVVMLSILCLVEARMPYSPYMESINMIRNGKNEIQDQLLSMHGNVPNITDPRRHYAILISHFLEVGNALATNCSAEYEDVYIDLLPISITRGFTKVGNVIKAVTKQHKAFNKDIKKIISLIHTICSDTERQEICNNKIRQIAFGDPKRYQHASDVLLAGGVMAEEFLDANLIPVADEYDEINYLINHMHDLKDLILAVAERISNKKECR